MKIRIVCSILFGAALCVASCQPETVEEKNINEIGKFSSAAQEGDDFYCQDGTYWGPAVYFNKAKIRSFVTIQNSEPQAIGYQILNSAFQNLPNPSAPEYTELLIPLPVIPCQALLYTHLTFHWNPQGHDPMGVYSVPHFDFHFYKIPLAERLAIDQNDPAITLAPASCFIPSNYYGPIGPLSSMGSHWVDLLSPEFNGGTFTKTFIIGSHNGQVIFDEPMVTLAHLSNPSLNDVIPIRQAAEYHRSGYYPTNYRIKKDNLFTTISLTDFVYRTAVSGICE